MYKILPLFYFSLLSFTCLAQDHGFKFGQTRISELKMENYPKDSTANALVLDEFGESYIDNTHYDLLHKYHVKTKIFNSKGFDKANISIPVYKQEGKEEIVYDIKASTFNWANGTIEETKFDNKNIYLENLSKYVSLVKFTMPNVREGSIIEIKYTLRSPFIFNFKTWEFQSDIPKVHSEYWAKIPANYTYNISLRGYQKLNKNEASIVKDCLTQGGGGKADCGLSKYAMDDVAAFIEEDYMTAKSNFLSAINFELSEIRYFDGRVDKISKEWEDVDLELKRETRFGGQMSKGKAVFKDQLDPLLLSEDDPLNKAKIVYDFVKEWYRWNNMYGKYSEDGIKKAFQNKTGNVGDINLSLIAALKYAGLHAEPVILSTRDNGLLLTLYPLISDFNYVITRLEIDGSAYLLDATDPYLPFGMIPTRCLNGKARVMVSKGASNWIDLMPEEKLKEVIFLNLKLQEDGKFTGIISNSCFGYDALDRRKKINSFNNQDEYIEDLDDRWNRIKILNYKIENLDSLENALTETLEVEIEGFDNLDSEKLLFNPFFAKRFEENPFKSKERLYPVDLGAPIEIHVILKLEYPENFKLMNRPPEIALSLPNNGGKYLFNILNSGNILTLNNTLSLTKPLYSSEEYHYLKELFNRIVQAHKLDLIFAKKQ